MGALSPVHLIIVLVIALLVIGPGKLPETGAALGRAIRDFRQAVDGTQPAETSPAAAPVGPAPMQASALASGGTATDDTGTSRPS
jgi:sec-independent protein translocase protein TatA